MLWQVWVTFSKYVTSTYFFIVNDMEMFSLKKIFKKSPNGWRDGSGVKSMYCCSNRL